MLISRLASNSSLYIPREICSALGLSVGDAVSFNIEKDGVLLKSDFVDNFIMEKSRGWLSILASLSACSIALVYNNTLLVLADENRYTDFSKKAVNINTALVKYTHDFDGVFIKIFEKPIHLLPWNAKDEVISYIALDIRKCGVCGYLFFIKKSNSSVPTFRSNSKILYSMVNNIWRE